MIYQKSLLVSCVGAYAGCGNGTGGFVCIHNDKTVVIDELDCTGLYKYNDTVYRFVRALNKVVGYNTQGIKYTVSLLEVKDGHDLLIKDDQIICVSTGTNEIHWYDCLGNLVKKWKADGEGDAWHLNSISISDDNLYVSAFGEFKEHRGWTNNKSKGQGFVLNLESGKKVLENLSSPHHPKYVNGNLLVCNSLADSLILENSSGKIDEICLDGFTRGLAYDDSYLYVGESQNRKIQEKSHSSIAIIELKTLQVIDRVKVPFAEIYEILLIAPDFATKIIEETEKYILSKSDLIYLRNKLVIKNQKSEKSRKHSELFGEKDAYSIMAKTKKRIKSLLLKNTNFSSHKPT